MILSVCRSFVGIRPLRTRWSAHIVAALLFCLVGSAGLVAAPGAQVSVCQECGGRGQVTFGQGD